MNDDHPEIPCPTFEILSQEDGSFLVMRCIIEADHDGECAFCVSVEESLLR
ncbi:MAG: hypothetical protein ACE37K_25195 [Planctomycetota bacterium]